MNLAALLFGDKKRRSLGLQSLAGLFTPTKKFVVPRKNLAKLIQTWDAIDKYNINLVYAAMRNNYRAFG